MTRKLLSFLLLVGFFAVCFGQACSDFGGAQNNEFSSMLDANGFGLSPANATVATGGTVQFVPVGGQGPYTWGINNGGGGSVSASGLYTAPASAAGNGALVVISCTDSLGMQAYASVSVGAGGLAATFSPNPATPGTLVTIQVSGGQAPYTIQQTAGGGSLSGFSYLPPSTAEMASFTINDSRGASTNLTIPIGTSAGGVQMGILELSMTTPGLHVVNGPGCPTGYTLSGMIADGSYDFQRGVPYFNGDINFCMLYDAVQPGRPYVSDMYLGQSCPSGFRQVAAYPICTSICWGNMVLCAKFSDSGVPPVRDFYITQENIHNPSGPNCNAGYTSIGKTTDCGYANCSGYQNFCILK